MYTKAILFCRFRVWFYFTVNNVCAEQRVIFNIVNFSKTKSLYRDGMSPLVKSTSRTKWYVMLCKYSTWSPTVKVTIWRSLLICYRQRIPSKSVFYYRCPDHGNNYVLSYAFAFDREDDTYHVSHTLLLLM